MARLIGPPRTLQDALEVTDIHIKVNGNQYVVIAQRDKVTRDGNGVEFERAGGDRVRLTNDELTNQVRNSVIRIIEDIDTRE